MTRSTRARINTHGARAAGRAWAWHRDVAWAGVPRHGVMHQLVHARAWQSHGAEHVLVLRVAQWHTPRDVHVRWPCLGLQRLSDNRTHSVMAHAAADARHLLHTYVDELGRVVRDGRCHQHLVGLTHV